MVFLLPTSGTSLTDLSVGDFLLLWMVLHWIPFMLLFWTESCKNVNFSISHWSTEIGFSIYFMVKNTCHWKDRPVFSFHIWGNTTSVSGKSLKITFITNIISNEQAHPYLLDFSKLVLLSCFLVMFFCGVFFIPFLLVFIPDFVPYTWYNWWRLTCCTVVLW